MSVDDFNAQVFARIDAVKARITASGIIAPCELSGTIFPGDISFKAYDKSNPLPGGYFNRATFCGKTIFDLVKFNYEVDFENAKFSGIANFWQTKFGGETTFRRTTFGGLANFLDAKFGGKTDFWLTKFSGETIFRLATFGDSTGHSCGSANFWKATFGGEVDFDRTNFCCEAIFDRATFSDKAFFGNSTFSGKANFRLVQTEKNALLMDSLGKESLANLNFTSMETECFSFKGCTWPDGGLWPETQEQPDYKSCEELYRSLKQKAASEHDQPLVSKWHYREKLMALEQIKAKRGWKARLGLTGLYYWCSGFGEDPAQAFRVLVGLLGFAFLALCGLKLWETGFGNYRPDWGRILEIPAELLALIPFVKTEAKALSNVSGVLAPAKAIVMGLLHLAFAAQLALFAFALRNRFRR